MSENLQYWSPTRQKRWISWWELCSDFPLDSIPQFMDLPEIDAYQIWPIPFPEEPEGYLVEWLYEPELREDGKYYETYHLIPYPEV